MNEQEVIKQIRELQKKRTSLKEQDMALVCKIMKLRDELRGGNIEKGYYAGTYGLFCKVYTTLEDLDFELNPILVQEEVQGTVYCQDKDTKEPVWIVSRGDEWSSWWEVNRVPDFYKRKIVNEVKSLLISARNRFHNVIDGVMIPPDERYREKSRAFEELEKALKELED